MSLTDLTPTLALLGPLATETAFQPFHDNQLLRRLAASLAHNVNNALTGVIGFLELGLRPAEPDLEGHLRASLACAYQAADVVKRIVAFTFRAKLIEALAPVSLREVAEQVAAELRHRLPATVTVEVAAADPCRVWANEPLVRRTVDHLADNALEAMPRGGTLRLLAQEGPGRHRLAVGDTGEGMPPEVREHLFEPFLTTKATGHLGLGLALCREMTEAQGGAIEVASGPGGGTEVALSFAALAADETLPRLDGQQATAGPRWVNEPRPLTRYAS
jgi:signal transduction histidine kinase